MSRYLQLRWLAVALFAVASQGCLILPYGFPTIERIAAMPVPSPSDEVHVFRVEGKATRTESGGPCFAIYHNVEEVRRLERIDCDDAAIIDAQWNMNFEHGRLRVGLLGGIPEKHYGTLAVRLYRRGYETIQVKADDEPRALEWKPVVDIAGYEQALDDLLDYRDSSEMNLPWNAHRTSLAAGGTSSAHREALWFCAAEYERIAGMILSEEPDREESHVRLLRKAKRLRELAGQSSERS